ncbi:MAG: hypothetical protein PX634_09220 [Microcystis sp. M53600_WE12]|nr:hypothetical protein [Microcystis sp. M53600_WE12]
MTPSKSVKPYTPHPTPRKNFFSKPYLWGEHSFISVRMANTGPGCSPAIVAIIPLLAILV